MAAPNILCDCTGMSEKRWLECREHGPKGDIEYTVGGSDVWPQCLKITMGFGSSCCSE